MKKSLAALIFAFCSILVTSCGNSVVTSPIPPVVSSTNSSSIVPSSSVSSSVTISTLTLTADRTDINIGDSITLKVDADPVSLLETVTYEVSLGKNLVSIEGNVLTAVGYGQARIYAISQGVRSENLVINIGDSNEPESIIIRALKYYLNVGESATLSSTFTPSNYVRDNIYTIDVGYGNATIEGNIITGNNPGKVLVSSRIGNIYSNSLEIEIVIPGDEPEYFYIYTSSDENRVSLGSEITLSSYIYPTNSASNIAYVTSNDHIEIVKDKVKGLKTGTTSVYGVIGSYRSSPITITVTEYDDNPYANINKEEFYANYTPATSYQDSVDRTEYFLLSGSLDEQDQAPTMDSARPMRNGMFIRNSSSYYSDDRLTYNLVDKYNNVVKSIYYGAAYVTLEDVACYIYAFGDIPANYTESKSTSPQNNEWGKYLRLNNTYFSGDTSNYPYEPALPNNYRGVGGLVYYEMDIGTTGTDCDPKYVASEYNNGTSIVRGAARIVYARYKYTSNSNYEEIIDPNDRYLFYTYNHYNDFQEYLNYAGGWGEMFGNITGGGQISSREDYNPTPYVESLPCSFPL